MGKPTEALASPSLLLLLPLIFFSSFLSSCMAQKVSAFSENYVESWGGDHIQLMNGGSEALLSMDKASGAGFGSKLSYNSGLFHLRIKLPENSAGVVTAFYLASNTDHHDELDIEFLGNVKGKPIIMQTNVFVNGQGNREQRVNLWFDPTADLHDYRILWNPYQIVFYVDNTPIRVFANKASKGAGYPSQPMQIKASLWNGDDWATDGGRTKVNWYYSPFRASFQGFDVDGCASTAAGNPQCSSSSLWWNSARYQQLSQSEEQAYQNVKKNYMTYDYCDDTKRFPAIPLECPQ